MKMIKVVWCIFQQCLRTSAMLLLEGSSEAGLFRHLSNLVFGVRHVRNIKARRVIFFSKYLKFNLDFKNAARNSEKGFCFWDNCIWIGIVKLSLLKTGYFSSAANVSTSSPKVWNVHKRDFFDLISLAVIDEYDKGVVMQITTVLGHVYHVPCRMVLWSGTF